MRQLLTSIRPIIKPQGHIFHGWRIASAGATVNFTGAILFFHAFGAYLLLIENEFGWNKALLAGAFSLARIESALLGPIHGWLIDRYGAKVIIRFGLFIFGFSLIGFSTIDSIIEFYIYFFLISLGTSLGGFLTVTVALVNWFVRHRTKALAFLQLGASIGGILVPVTISCLETFGWRLTAFGSGLIVLLITWPLTRSFNHRPENIGETPDGILVEQPNRPQMPTATIDILGRENDFTVRQAFKTRAFWFLALGHATSLLIVGAVMTHLVLHVNGELGYSLTVAGLVVSFMTLMQIVGLISTSFLGDRINKRSIVITCMMLHAIGMLLLSYADNLWMVIGFAAFHGIAWGSRGPLMQAIRADYFGTSHFGSIMGWSSIIVMLGMAFGPVYAGYIADHTGSYQAAFNSLAGAALIGAIFFLLAKQPCRTK